MTGQFVSNNPTMLQTSGIRVPQTSTNKQWIAAFAVLLLKLQVGIVNGWNSPNISRLTGENSPIPITLEQASWLVSLVPLGGAVALIIGAVSIEFFGSKKTIILSLVAFLVSHICVICASSVELLYAARTMSGVGNFFTYICFSIFIGEIATPQIRGTLIALATVGTTVGNVFATIAETYVQMKITSSIYLTLCIVDLMLICWLRNTPYYFVKKGDNKNAKRSIAFYRGDDEEDKIFEDVEKFIEARSSYTLKDKIEDFRLPVIRKSMFLIAILSTMPSLCGHTTIMGYMETILRNAKSTLVEPQEMVIYINLATIVSSLTTVKLTDIFGRRKILLVSSSAVVVSMITLGFHFYLLQVNYDPDKLQLIPYFAIIFYVILLFVCTPVPSIVLSELFPENLKSTAAFLAGLNQALFSFIITKMYQSIVDFAGEMYAFWMYAVLVAVIIIPCIFLLPETKGKSFQEIQEALMNKDEKIAVN